MIHYGDRSMYIYKEIKKLFNCLADDESKNLFLNIYNYSLSGDKRYLFGRVDKCEGIRVDDQKRGAINKWVYDYFYGENNKNKLIIYGINTFAVLVYHYLQSVGIAIECFCSFNSNKNNTFCNCHIMSPETVVKKYRDSFILLIEQHMSSKMVYLASKYGFKDEQIIILPEVPKAYFSLPELKPIDNEVFVDAGSYDGETILDFIEWNKGKYKKIFAIEPDEGNYAKVKKNIDDNEIKRVTLYSCGLWSEKIILPFEQLSTSCSSVSNCGNDNIQANCLDSIINEQQVTLIKLDIEGSELEALKGAASTICKWQPRLIVGIYHKPEDIIEIPLYIHSLVPAYRFYIRQHSFVKYDTVYTVLYAI